MFLEHSRRIHLLMFPEHCRGNSCALLELAFIKRAQYENQGQVLGSWKSSSKGITVCSSSTSKGNLKTPTNLETKQTYQTFVYRQGWPV